MSQLRKTYVINLYGAPGAGKSIIASGLHYKLGIIPYDTELVREWIKEEIWENTSVHNSEHVDKDQAKNSGVQYSFNDFNIVGGQSKLESTKYHKQDYIVTDSPLLLNVFYAQKRNPIMNFLPQVQSFMNNSRQNGVEYINFFIHRDPKANFNQLGRVHNEEETKAIEKELKQWLSNMGEKWDDILGTGEERLETLLSLTLEKTGKNKT